VTAVKKGGAILTVVVEVDLAVLAVVVLVSAASSIAENRKYKKENKQ
jgi:hypothetical protein